MINLYANTNSIACLLAQAMEYGDEEVTIYLEAGVYHQPLEIKKSHLTLIGKGPEETIFSYNYAALEPLSDGKRGTFRSQTVLIDADYVSVKDLSFKNTAGPGEIAGQALALYSDGDYLTFDNCHFYGYQDTLFTAPLPPKEVEVGGFRGPKEFAPRKPGRQLYKNCRIEGTVDFIFGGGLCYFLNCELVSLKRPDGAIGYVTAASTPEKQPYGYVFKDCAFTGNAKPHSVYLGRPWREFAHVAILHSYLGPHIHPLHWHDWNKTSAHDTIQFYEFENYGPGTSSAIADFAKELSKEKAAGYELEPVFFSLYKGKGN